MVQQKSARLLRDVQFKVLMSKEEFDLLDTLCLRMGKTRSQQVRELIREAAAK